MGAPKTGNVRNVVLVGQGGVGKTSLAEAMLHLSGKTARLGGHDGTKPTLDYDPEEVKRAFSISTTIAPIDWKGARINVLDAPCYPDFIGDAFAAMSVCETALFVVDAEAGPQPTTVKLWYAAEDLRLPPCPGSEPGACGVRKPPVALRGQLCDHNGPAAGALWYAPGRRDSSLGRRRGL